MAELKSLKNALLILLLLGCILLFGCEDTMDYMREVFVPSEEVGVHLSPVAAFTADVTSGAAPLTVQFIDHSAGDITKWQWEFDAASYYGLTSLVPNSTEQNPSFTYSIPGEYSVKLTIKGPGGSDSMTRKAYIQVK
jgi:PKD repeat protein